MTIQYLKGDATQPVGEGTKIICHGCNCVGAWGAGFVKALSKRWREPERVFRKAHREGRLRLGHVDILFVTHYTWVANCCIQEGIGPNDGIPRVRYTAVRGCFAAVRFSIQEDCQLTTASIHMPRIGCGLAGGSWDQIEPIINEEFINKGIPVTVYDL